MRAGALLLLVLAACGGGDATADSAAADSARRASLATADAAVGPPTSITQETEADLTADGTPELVRVTARGARPESLAVTLVVLDRAGARELHREQWSSGAWLARIDPAVLTPAIADSIVRRRVDDVLGDSAVVPGAKGAPPVLRWSTGDAQQAITWNPTERRFVRVR